MPVVELGGGLGGARVGAAAGLGQPERAERLAAGEQRQPLLLLRVVAEPVDRHGAQRHPGLERDGDALVDLAEFLERQAQREVVAAHAAVLLGERQAEQSHVGHPGDHLVRERVFGVVFGGDGCDDAPGEVADRLGQLFVVVGQRAGGQEVGHDGISSVATMIRASTWPTLTWSPTATSSSTTPSTGAESACSIFIASTVTTTVPADDRRPVSDADGDDRTRHRADEFGVAAVLVVGPHRRLAHLLDQRSCRRRPPARPAPSDCGDHVLGTAGRRG